MTRFLWYTALWPRDARRAIELDARPYEALSNSEAQELGRLYRAARQSATATLKALIVIALVGSIVGAWLI